nr:methyl-accepting chemotaxis protein [Phenylobacterium sp.]
MLKPDHLDRRLEFMRLNSEGVASLRRLTAVLTAELPSALDAFYDQIRATPETRDFFAEESRIASAKDRQLAHWRAISAGEFDERYVAAVTKVGETHARIGLEPRWYIGGYALLIEQLLTAVLHARWPKARLGGRRGEEDETAAELSALIKAALLDIDYSISVYLEAAEAARKRAEAEVLAAEREMVVRSIGRGVAALAQGDLSHRITDETPAEYVQLRDDFNDAMARLESTMRVVLQTSGRLSTNCEELASASDNLSRRTEQQAAGLEQTAAALGEIDGQLRQTANGAGQAAQTMNKARVEVERSSEVVAGALESVARIDEASREIGQIIGVIDEIAFQTNLLALNAGVEAARAGDAGKGFAVVATEVRALAQRSAEAAKEIKALISKSSQQVAAGVQLVQEAGGALSMIVAQVAEAEGAISTISASTQEQSAAFAQVSTTVNQMDQVVQQNAAMVEQSTAATHSIKSETLELDGLIRRFRLGAPETSAADAGFPRLASIAGGRARDGRDE